MDKYPSDKNNPGSKDKGKSIASLSSIYREINSSV